MYVNTSACTPPLTQNESGHINITSLNIKGANSPPTRNKWKKIIHSITHKNIPLFCAVKTHSDDPQIESLNQTYNPKFTFTHTHDKDKPKTKGITIVNNTLITKSPLTDIQHIIPSWAIQFSTNWPPKSLTTILVTYAPNPPNENKIFWDKLAEWYENPNSSKPHILLGDLNLVKDAPDHLPPHPDPPQAISALQNLKNKLGLTNGWRQANPLPECKYTFAQPGNGSQSRIDHIYTTENIINNASVWSIENPEVPTDHQLIRVKLHGVNTLQIGCGCWAIRPFLLKDKKFIRNIKHIRSEITNPMTISNTPPQQHLQNFIKLTCTSAQKQSKLKARMINSKTKKT